MGKCGATLSTFPLMYIEINSKKFFIFNLSPCYLLNYMCMENLETFFTPQCFHSFLPGN